MYAVAVPALTDSIKVTAAVADPCAMLTINGMAAPGGSADVALTAGELRSAQDQSGRTPPDVVLTSPTSPPKRPDTWEADRRRRSRIPLRGNSRSPASRCTRRRSRTPIVRRCWSGAHSRSSPPGRSTQKAAHHNRGNSQRSGDTDRGAGCRTSYCRRRGRRPWAQASIVGSGESLSG